MVNNMENVDARELQMLEQYLEQFTQQVEAYSRQLEMLENRRMETATAVETLNNLAGQEEPTVLLQIGGGASLRVHVPDTDQVLLNIGADVVVERTNTETVDYLGERMTEMEALAKKLLSPSNRSRNRVAMLPKEWNRHIHRPSPGWIRGGFRADMACLIL